MNPRQFAMWLAGYLDGLTVREGTGPGLTEAQLQKIRDKLEKAVKSETEPVRIAPPLAGIPWWEVQPSTRSHPWMPDPSPEDFPPGTQPGDKIIWSGSGTATSPSIRAPINMPEGEE